MIDRNLLGPGIPNFHANGFGPVLPMNSTRLTDAPSQRCCSKNVLVSVHKSQVEQNLKAKLDEPSPSEHIG